jgi:hypothetical protein
MPKPVETRGGPGMLVFALVAFGLVCLLVKLPH